MLIQPPRPSLFDPFTGIVTSISEVEMARSDPQLFVVASRTADVAAYGFPTTAIIHGSAAGLNARAAYAATIGECAERYACCVVHPEDLVYGSYRDLLGRGYAPVPPEKWTLFDKSQYDRLPYVPFEDDTPIAWAQAESLTYKRERLVPACLVYLCSPETFMKEGARLLSVAISTGAACARSHAEALIKGICEVVERDAYIITWRNRLPRPHLRIDPQSAIYSLFNERFARPGLEFNLVYTTLDLSIASFFGILRDTRCSPPRMIVGGAAHLDPCAAALKTLTELVQGLKWMDSFDGSSFPIEQGFQNVRSFEDRVLLYASNYVPEAFSFLFEDQSEIDLSAIPSLDTGDVRANLHLCYELLEAQGLEILALDLTTVDLSACGLYVTKVLIPECQPMEGDHRAQLLGGRRWREVPVRLGLCAAPTSIESVNPWPHPYP